MKPRAHLYELRLGFVSRGGPVILGASCLGGPCWRPEGGDESRRRGSLEAAVLGQKFGSDIPLGRRFVPSLPFHRVSTRQPTSSVTWPEVGLDTCHSPPAAGTLTPGGHLCPPATLPSPPPPRPPAKLRPTISTANIIQQNHSSSRRHWSALGAGRQPIYLPKDDVSFFGSCYRMDGDGTRSGGR